jgi:predicted nucleic acid-binding protein
VSALNGTRGVLDTSVFIADEQERELDAGRVPDEAAISVVTLAELELGVHLARSESQRGRRLRTLQAAQATYVALPVDEAVASAFAELVATARDARRRPKVQDAWIAATARAHGVAVYTQDADFDDLAVDVVRI